MLELKKILRYPCAVLFGALLIVLTIIDILAPDKYASELENRVLTPNPAFSFSMLAENRWTREYGEYTREQFIARDGWLKIHSFFEQSLLKLELGGVWLARDGYLMAKTPVDESEWQRTTNTNTQAVCSLAEKYPGKVFVMLVPSASNILAGHLRFAPPRMDENAVMDTIHEKLRESGISVIDLRGAFLGYASSGRQIYYRTDHHWTTDGGALTAYEEFCRAAGREAVLPPEKIKNRVDGFLGTNYAKALNTGVKADHLVYYDFPNTLTIEKPATGGSSYMQEEPLMAYGKLSSYDKYASFLHGNNSYSHINGDGEGSIVVIKDSFGNSFVPFLTQNYKDIEIIDLRGRRNLDDILDSGNDILVLYSVATFTQDTDLAWLGSG